MVSEALRRKLQEYVQHWQRCLDNPKWKPDRSHVEMARSQLQRAANECAALTAALADQVVVARPRAFLDWAAEMFGPVALERRERLTRFVEEALELAAAERMPISLLEKLIGRVWASPQGETRKELGQVQACLETFAESIGLSADGEAAREFARVQSIPKEEWTRRHRVKIARGIADVPAPPPSAGGG